jgi:hypothetical protein
MWLVEMDHQLIIRKTFFFFFLTCPRKRGRGIRTSDLHFIRRGSSRLNYLLETNNKEDLEVFLELIIS